MLNKARAASGTRKGENVSESEGNATPVTRDEFFEMVLRVFGMEAEPALDVPGLLRTKPGLITRGEAAEILMRAMTEKK
jgi:hypothetical protein